jgi:hypothetical protein
MSKTTAKTVTEQTPSTEVKSKVDQYDLAKVKSEHGNTKSGAIRYLASEGLSRSDIVKVFKNGGDPIVYQHVRQVLVQKVKKEV